MDKPFSLILDLSRFLAALLVFFHHAEQHLKDPRLSALASFGHDAVIFFFILSGFVIAYVTEHKEKTLAGYATARLARLYSVTLPSLLLAYGLFEVGSRLLPGHYAIPDNLTWGETLLTSTFFLNRFLDYQEGIPTNAPYWSICYEAWYYVLFGAAFYLKGLQRLLVVAVAALVAGFNILLLMPIWLLGFACYRHQHRLPRSPLVGTLLVAGALGAYLWMRVTNFDDRLFIFTAHYFGGEQAINASLHFSKRFLPDFVIAVLFVTLFAGLHILRAQLWPVLSRAQKAIQKSASHTFALYLFHSPVLLFLAGYSDNSLLVMALCLAVVVALGHLTEQQKPRLAALIGRWLAAPRSRPTATTA